MIVHLNDFEHRPHIFHAIDGIQFSERRFTGGNDSGNSFGDVGVFNQTERPVRVGVAGRNI
ncbi:hypothetical protein A9255_03200 [Xenorhabdus hominickii]|uniref:Uncharacterized protein n=1 Tax=Xenorhabdus hominickii TaxID=351679 RepID=A0ABM6DPA2_XENHO|nr:hypothetical protein A9255_03200 [Xenorhabdus hominickii]